jgi:hypothetical protein
MPNSSRISSAVLLIIFACCSGQRSDIKKAYVLFSNHLDIGYTDNINGSCAGAVTNRYWHDHFPRAIETAKKFRLEGKRTYKWMVHSWLVSMFRHCLQPGNVVNIDGPGHPNQLVCPNASALAAFEAGVKRGDITWHAFPFNAEPEVYSPYLFEASLNLTFAEDDYFGHAHRMTYNQRDVPGLTRAAIPLLRKSGVKAVSVGENGACADVNVPPIFLWRDNATETEVIAMYHPRGYGVDDKETAANDNNNNRRRRLHESGRDNGIHYNQHGELIEGRGDCVEVEEAQAALCYAWRSDNKVEGVVVVVVVVVVLVVVVVELLPCIPTCKAYKQWQSDQDPSEK